MRNLFDSFDFSSKSKEQKNLLALVLAGGITLSIAFVWFLIAQKNGIYKIKDSAIGESFILAEKQLKERAENFANSIKPTSSNSDSLNKKTGGAKETPAADNSPNSSIMGEENEAKNSNQQDFSYPPPRFILPEPTTNGSSNDF